MTQNKKKAWGGRFTQDTDPLVESFNASLGYDRRLYRQDIQGSIAHALMLGRQGIIPKKEAQAIAAALERIMREIEEDKFVFDPADEDIHMAVESRLSKMTGKAVGGKLHTARSRNDQVATSFRLYTRDRIDDVARLLRGLMRALAARAKEHLDTAAPGYTHLQPAQPIRLAHWFLAYYEMFARDVERFAQARRRVNVMPLGSAALAGTNFPIDREWVARQLGFEAISENSMDAVADRDFALDFLYAASVTATHLSRLAEELVVFTSFEFGVMELPDAYCTGSSIMPQKKNPDVPELIRGKAGRLYGHLMAMLTMLKGLPLAYNKDMQEDKEPVLDAADQLIPMLTLAARIIERLKVNTAPLAKRAGQGYMTAVDIADRLVMAGVPFREAHEIVGRLTRYCLDRGMAYTSLAPSDLKELDPRLAPIFRQPVTPLASADGKDVPGGTARRRILARLKAIDKEMSKWPA